MSYFLSSQKLNTNNILELEGEEARHILLSRRMRVGDVIKIQGQDGKRFEAEISKISKNSLQCMVKESIPVPKELTAKSTLFQSVVSEKALDFIFQKATELGAAGITLFNSQNTATKLSTDLFQKKQDRWNKILWEAAKQCDRVQIPELKFISGIDQVTSESSNYGQIFILDASGSSLTSSILHPQSASALALTVGPEGGFTSREFEQLKTIPNSRVISLSPFTLRAETAAIAGISTLVNFVR